MAWRVEVQKSAERELDRLGTEAARRILRFLNDWIAKLDDPRAIGEPLRGSELGEFWKYLVGDYRVIARIEDESVLILIVRIGHRRDVYRRT